MAIVPNGRGSKMATGNCEHCELKDVEVHDLSDSDYGLACQDCMVKIDDEACEGSEEYTAGLSEYMTTRPV